MTDPIWIADNAPSARWPLYTRGNVGEVFPEVVLPLTWTLYGKAAEDGWRDAFRDLGLLRPGDIDANESMTILGVFGGYCYINASYVRLLGVRAPGGTVDAIDQQFFGESEAPAYVARPGDKNLGSTLRLGGLVLKLLRTTSLPQLEVDKEQVAEFVARRPSSAASDAELLSYLVGFQPLFQQLFARHISNTFSLALVSGALADLCTKAGHPDALVAILGGIGDVESAAPSAAMWDLARRATETSQVNEAFAAGVDGLRERLTEDSAAADWLVAFDGFLTEFGSRGPNEWDLGSDPWALRESLALSAIDRMREADSSHDPRSQATRLAGERALAVTRVLSALKGPDKFMFTRMLRATTLFSQGRERSKTTIIRAIHAARLVTREIGTRGGQRGGPADARAVCMLALNEVAQFLDAPASFAEIIDGRAAQREALADLIPPFIFEGAVSHPSTWDSRGASHATLEVGAVIQGIPGCPGTAQGRARVVLDPGDPRGLGTGDVLVAPLTDPSWTPLFLAAEAVVVDVGAVMSHAVIVSRELGIPCVVSAVGATTQIADGALIEVDGSTGRVTILET